MCEQNVKRFTCQQSITSVKYYDSGRLLALKQAVLKKNQPSNRSCPQLKATGQVRVFAPQMVFIYLPVLLVQAPYLCVLRQLNFNR